MELQVWCHVFTAGWREPVDDLIAAFDASGLKSVSSTVRLGVVGPKVGRRAVVRRFGSCELKPAVQTLADLGNEAVTINAIREWAKEHPGDAVLYCHTKGASRPIEVNRRWRRAMVAVLISRWREVLASFERDEFDAAGPFWVNVDSHPDAITYGWRNDFFGGNFWMARNDYLARLPEVAEHPRGLAEQWIGLLEPRVWDLLPGFPDYEFFGLEQPAA